MPQNTNNQRISFATSKTLLDYPDFLEVQLKSFREFFQLGTTAENRKNEGLYKVFQEAFSQNSEPSGIRDTRNNFVLEFIDYTIDPPIYTEDECMDRGLTYCVPMKAKLKLSCTDPEHEDFEQVVQDVFLGNIPYMTPRGTFIINGSERIVVSQLHRSPGVFFGQSMHQNGTKLYSARIIPFKGSWIEFTTDINKVMFAYIDRKKKLPVTTLLRAIGFESDKDILNIFGLAQEVRAERSELEKHIGQKFAARVLKKWYQDFIDEETGEVTYLERNIVSIDRGTILTEEVIDKVLDSGVDYIQLHNEDAVSAEFDIIYNTLQKDTCNTQKDAIFYTYRQLRNSEPPDEATAKDVIEKLFFSDKRYDLGTVGRYRLNKKLNLNTSEEVRVLTKQDIIEIIRYLIQLINSKATVDDIDHLSNRRIRTVGEQLSNQFSVGLARMARTIREKMNVRDNEVFTPSDLINSKTLSSVINSFFGTSQLSQFMDQTNPLAEMTHKRRLSALGPGGLSRDRAGFEVRDVHYTHYGRLCPIETPEGPNIGLISSLCVYARINNLGFIETPYRKVNNGVVDLSNEGFVYMSAEEEENQMVAQANVNLDDKGNILDERIKCRWQADYPVVSKDEVHLIDVAPNQIASIAASLIPFLEHDDANRALMGSNMMRQAIPIINPEAPIVGTGLEGPVMRDSRTQISAEGDGEVVFVDATQIQIKYDKTEEEKFISFTPEVTTYKLPMYRKTNQSTSVRLKPIVRKGDRVTKGQILTEGYASQNGELALGRNLKVAFMPWKGYNYEDAVVLSERIVREDILTSVHVDEYLLEVRDTKGETDPSPEEKLLRAIFGDKAGDVKDASLKASASLTGTVIGKNLYCKPGQGKMTDKEKKNFKAKMKEETEKAKQEYNKKYSELKNLFIEKMMTLLGKKTSQGVTDIFGTAVIAKGSTFKKEVLESIDSFEYINPSKWTTDKHTNELVSMLIHNYLTEVKDITAKYKRKEFDIQQGIDLPNGVMQVAKVYIAKKRKIMVGDKVAGRHGNKGIVAKIVSDEDMPFMEDGTIMDIVLNPLGVPSRMNLGQIYETVLGWAGKELGLKFATPIFDGASLEDICEYTDKAGLPRYGETRLRDGGTGELFDQPATVGVIYMIKLDHMVEDKMHARSTGPYSLITQQPLGGKAQLGGQRFGEMEVWALEAFGAANILQEILTIKSDDITGRSRAYEAIVKGEPMPAPNIPESLNVLLHELRGLGLSVHLD